MVTGFVSEPRGVNYGVWRHPLTPYYRVKADTLPVHAPQGRIGYRQWLGLVYADEKDGRLPATIMKEARDRLGDLAEDFPHFSERPLALAGGFAMDNMKALAFAEAEMPLHLVRDELAEGLSDFARRTLSTPPASSIPCSRLRCGSLCMATRARPISSSTTLDAPRERLWAETESDFHVALDEAIGILADAADDPDRPLRERWRKTLETTARRISTMSRRSTPSARSTQKRVVDARRLLTLGLKGYGKYGRSLFDELVLPPPEAAQKTRGKSGRKKKEEAAA